MNKYVVTNLFHRFIAMYIEYRRFEERVLCMLPSGRKGGVWNYFFICSLTMPEERGVQPVCCSGAHEAQSGPMKGEFFLHFYNVKM